MVRPGKERKMKEKRDSNIKELVRELRKLEETRPKKRKGKSKGKSNRFENSYLREVRELGLYDPEENELDDFFGKYIEEEQDEYMTYRNMTRGGEPRFNRHNVLVINEETGWFRVVSKFQKENSRVVKLDVEDLIGLGESVKAYSLNFQVMTEEEAGAFVLSWTRVLRSTKYKAIDYQDEWRIHIPSKYYGIFKSCEGSKDNRMRAIKVIKEFDEVVIIK